MFSGVRYLLSFGERFPDNKGYQLPFETNFLNILFIFGTKLYRWLSSKKFLMASRYG
jgi:hypothetical protein